MDIQIHGEISMARTNRSESLSSDSDSEEAQNSGFDPRIHRRHSCPPTYGNIFKNVAIEKNKNGHQIDASVSIGRPIQYRASEQPISYECYLERTKAAATAASSTTIIESRRKRLRKQLRRLRTSHFYMCFLVLVTALSFSDIFIQLVLYSNNAILSSYFGGLITGLVNLFTMLVTIFSRKTFDQENFIFLAFCL